MGSEAAWVIAGALAGLLTGGWWVATRGRRATLRLREDLRIAREESREARASDEEGQGLILGSMQDGVLLFDADGRQRFANAAITAHLGSESGTIGSLMPLGLRNAAQQAADRREEATALVELGSPTRWLQVTATPVGEDGSILVVVRDVTQARLAEEVRRDFVANASHELKSPAASIKAAAETLRQAATDDPGAVPRFARQLESEADRLARILSDLLDLSRLEGGSELSDQLDLGKLIREEARHFEGPAADAGLRFVVETGGPAPVRGSARDLSLLVRNLLDNAIRYARSAGTVLVTTAVDERDVTLSVADDGVGIPTKDLPRIFERFYRVDRARSRETGGTGLGLAIVKHVAENHGGHVHVESELGRGTTIRVVLPRG